MRMQLSVYKMDWFTSLTIRNNDGPENEYEIELIENLLILHHEDNAMNRYIRKLDVIRPVEAQVVAGLVVLQVRRPRGTISVQIRFGSEDSKTAFWIEPLRIGIKIRQTPQVTRHIPIRQIRKLWSSV
jgi:hypothetical protein